MTPTTATPATDNDPDADAVDVVADAPSVHAKHLAAVLGRSMGCGHCHR